MRCRDVFTQNHGRVLCKPKQSGGLGFRRIEDLNKALVAKRGWELMAKPDSLWVRALTVKYCRGTNFLKARPVQGASWFWKSIMQIQDLVIASFCWGVQSSQELNIWSDPWVSDVEGFCPQLKMGTLVDRRIKKVSDLIDPNSRS